MIDGENGGAIERPAGQKWKPPRAWLLHQSSDFVMEDVNGGAEASDADVPPARLWSQYKGKLPQSEGKGKCSSEARWYGHPREAHHNAFRLLGLAMAIMVVIGLTSLFTKSPKAGIPISSLSSPPSARGEPTSTDNVPTAPPAHEDGAGAGPPTLFASNAAVSRVESRLLSFLENGSSKRSAFDLDQISFDEGKATLAGSSHDQLEQTAKILKAFPTARAGIWVYSDDGRSKGQNARLSFQRAMSVRAEMLRLGDGPSRLTLARAAKDPLLVAQRTREARVHEGQGGHVGISLKKMM